ncbi:GxxExxY protein [Undibacterium sp. Jales W-56]|uniref:GxxExxY protein n=1 Tax=Undibacterium sp. Jales W-56 TaxID=2897325 RepID=UPI0021D13C20|nr:GxxExxY protein [Undibacterium sp. Jales W-56]MCU6435156.1 GxxExxY protein [Undibacterium sp. Jales W-56]
MERFKKMPDQTSHHRDTETQRKAKHDLLSEQVIGAAIEVHKHLGPGLLESAYENCLCHELYLRKLSFKRQVCLDIAYKDIKVESAYRLDLIVENSLVLELKAIESLLPVHTAQLLTYLRLTGYKTGLLINFMVPVLKTGIKRVSL